MVERRYEMRKYTCFDIANYFLDKAKETAIAVTNLKLQKLVYYAQAWHLAINEEPLMKNTKFEAWIHGPVVRELWNKYRDYSYEPINEEVTSPELDARSDQLLEEVVEVYLDKDAYTMELMSHREDPWILARNGCADNERCTNIISEESMMIYFKSRLKQEE